MTSPADKISRNHLLTHATRIALVLMVAWMTSANTCAPASDLEDGFELPEDSETTQPSELTLAFAKLDQHDIRGASRDFGRAVAAAPGHGESLAGYGLTRALLLPEHPIVKGLLTDLGGQPMDMQADFWGDGGVLALYAQRTDQLKVDERLNGALPWSTDDLEDLDRIAARLDPALTGNDIAAQLAELAIELVDIAALLNAATEDPGFESFVFPRGTFHGRTFIGLRDAELHLLSGALEVAAAGLLWVSAYDWAIDADQLSPDHTLTERISHLNAIAFKAILAPERLTFSQSLLRKGLRHIESAVDRGFNALIPGSLLWSDLSLEEAIRLQAFFADMALSIGAATPISNTTPPITAHLGALYDDRTLTEGQGLILITDTDKDRDTNTLAPDYDGIQSLLLDGVLDPYCHPDPTIEDPTCPKLFTEGAGSTTPWQHIFAPFKDSLSKDYGL